MFSHIFTVGLACIAPFAAAYTQPKGNAPEGNPISQPGLNSVVPVGENFTITWEPTTSGKTVTLVLLKGPSTNAVPQYAIVEQTPNDGSYVWLPATDLEPTTGAMGYGIQLIDDSTGQYQYTTQFGISNPDYKQGSSSSSSSSSASMMKPTSSKAATAAPYPTGSVTTQVITAITTYCPEETTFAVNNKTYTVSGTTTITDCGPVTVTYSHTSSGHAMPTAGFYSTPAANVTMVAPTGGYKPTTFSSSAPSPTPQGPAPTYEGPAQTGAASHVAFSCFGLVAAAGVAVLAI